MANSDHFEDDFLKSLQSSSEKKSSDESVEGLFDFSQNSSSPKTPAASPQKSEGGDFFQFMEESAETSDQHSEPEDVFSFESENIRSETVETTVGEDVVEEEVTAAPSQEMDIFAFMEKGENTSASDPPPPADIFSLAEETSPEPEEVEEETGVEDAEDVPEGTSGNDFLAFMNGSSREETQEGVDLFSLSEKDTEEETATEETAAEEITVEETAAEEAEEEEAREEAEETVKEEIELETDVSEEGLEEITGEEDISEPGEAGEEVESEEILEEGEEEESDEEVSEDLDEEEDVEAGEEEIAETIATETAGAWSWETPPSEPPQKETSLEVEDKRIRCPGCDQEFYLSELIDVETGVNLDLAALIPAGLTTTQETETYALDSSNPFGASPSFSETSSVSEGTTPSPVRRVAVSKKKKKSLAKEIFYIVLGGLLAVPIAHYLAIPIQIYVQKVEKRGLLDIPTPFISSTYAKVKDYPWIPRWMLPGFDPEIHETANTERKESHSPSKKKSDKPTLEMESGDFSTDDEDWEEEDFSESTSLEEGTDDSDDFALTGDFTEVETPAEEDSTGLADLFGARPDDAPVATPATLPEALPLGTEEEETVPEESAPSETPETETAVTADVPSESTPLQTLQPPVYTAADLETAQNALPAQFSPEGMESFCQLAKVLTFLSPTSVPEAAMQSIESRLKTLATEERVVLNAAMVPLVTAENHGKGMVLAGTIEEPRKVRNLTAIPLKLDGMEKKLYIIHPDAGNFEAGKRYLFTGVVIDPNQDENAVVTAKKSPVVWRGASWKLD